MQFLISRASPWVLQSSADVRAIRGELQQLTEQSGGWLYVFDARRCATWEDFYRQCWDVLRPPQYFGENPVALYNIIGPSGDRHIAGLGRECANTGH